MSGQWAIADLHLVQVCTRSEEAPQRRRSYNAEWFCYQQQQCSGMGFDRWNASPSTVKISGEGESPAYIAELDRVSQRSRHLAVDRCSVFIELLG